ncbi:MAG: hypothetical protein ACE5IQ_03710 [Candidatus Methylomirabilales bacterium]
MRIKTAHKILIASAIAFFLFFGIWKFRAYAATGEGATLVSGLVSVLVALGFGVYFQSLRGREF